MTRLKEFRVQKGYSQNKVAKEANISLRMYQYYEANLKVPTVYAAIRIARALSTTVEELFPFDSAPLFPEDEI